MLNKPKFKIGDKVRVLPNGPHLENYHGTWISAMNIHIGKEYTIKKILNPDITEENIGPFYGYCVEGTFWTFDERNLELVKEKEEKPANIIFKFKKNKIIAKREGGLKATARCHPDDVYDIRSGIQLALNRLLAKEEKAEKIKKLPINGFYYCIKGDDHFSIGDIYRFEKGWVRTNYGQHFGPYKESQKLNNILYIDKAVFREIKWQLA